MDAVLALVDEVEGWPRMALTELPGDADWQSRMPVLCALVASILVRVSLLCLLLLQQRGHRVWAGWKNVKATRSQTSMISG